MAGMVLGIHFPDPEHIVLVSNIKHKTEVVEYLKDRAKDFAIHNPKINLGKVIEEWKNTQRTPPHQCVPKIIWQWIKPRWDKERISPKQDHYGLPAGKIDDYLIEQNPETFYELAMSFEWTEETGTVATFREPFIFISKNRVNGNSDYEHYFFYITEIQGELNKDGVSGETEAPEIIAICNLFPPTYRLNGVWPEGGIDLYAKHGFGIKEYLRKLVKDGGNEYKKSLFHMEKFFPREAKDIGLIQELETEPTHNMNGNQLWEIFTKGIKKI